MKKCKWAGDASDEYCKDCNGCELMFEGQKKVATDCAGYEAGDEDIDAENTSVEEHTEEPLPINPPVEEKKEKPKEEKKVETKPKKTSAKKKEEVKESVEENSAPTTKTEVMFESGKVKSIRCMSGATKEINGTYFKFESQLEIEVDPNATAEQIESDKKKLWDVLNGEIDEQLNDLTK